MPKVEIYTKFTCGFCFRAKSLLTSKGVEFDETEISADELKRAEMLQRSGGRTTVPQIFINDQHIGGSDDLVALERSGKLDGLLAT